MKYWVIGLVGMTLFSGCSLVIGKHPAARQRICVVCIEATNEFGAGLQVIPSKKPWYKKVAIGWVYE